MTSRTGVYSNATNELGTTLRVEYQSLRTGPTGLAQCKYSATYRQCTTQALAHRRQRSCGASLQRMRLDRTCAFKRREKDLRSPPRRIEQTISLGRFVVLGRQDRVRDKFMTFVRPLFCRELSYRAEKRHSSALQQGWLLGSRCLDVLPPVRELVSHVRQTELGHQEPKRERRSWRPRRQRRPAAPRQRRR